MGGAVNVPGNLFDKSSNPNAEFNMHEAGWGALEALTPGPAA